MSKKLVFGILGSVLILTVLGVYIMVGSLESPSQEEDGSSDLAETSGNAAEVSSTGEADRESNEKNPFEGDVKTPLNEKVMQQYIHAMSHQKVQAEEKWSFFKITDERIDFLLDQLEVNKYEHEDIYASILTSWKEGDFSQADNQHNEVWKLQGGTIGEATGVMSGKAEEAFLHEQKEESR
jgi:Family of unknown function (DUF6241)